MFAGMDGQTVWAIFAPLIEICFAACTIKRTVLQLTDIFVVGYAWFRNVDDGKDNKWSLTNMSMTPKTPLSLLGRASVIGLERA